MSSDRYSVMTLLKKGRKTEFFMVNYSGHCLTFRQKLGFFSGRCVSSVHLRLTFLAIQGASPC
jgi:hypothetical protein